MANMLSNITGPDSSERKPLSGPHAPIRSHAFTISRTVNPLVAASSPLFDWTSKLQSVTEAPTLGELHNELSHEICAFETKAQSLGYRAQVVLAARYLLCTLLDETITATDWGKKSDWSNNSLLINFQNESWGGERVFYILERAAEDPAIYIELLELGYLCLSLGLQGKYQREANGHIHLNELIDNLYRLIQHQQGEANKNFLISPQKPSHTNTTPRKLRLPPIWATVGVIGVILIGIYIPYRIHLDSLVNQVMTTLQASK